MWSGICGTAFCSRLSCIRSDIFIVSCKGMYDTWNQNLGTIPPTCSRYLRTHTNPTFLLTCSWHAPVHYDPNQSSHIHLQETSMNLWELMLRQVDCQVVNFFLVACIKYFLCCNRLHCLTLFLTSLHPCMSWTTACTKKANIVFKYSLSTFGKIPTDLKQLALCRWKPIPCVVL